jgi:hypothetical protein
MRGGRSRARFALASAVLAAAVAAPASAAAGDGGKVLVIAGRTLQEGPDAAVVREVRSALGDIDSVELMAPPPLDLEAVQLAIDCADESAQCLREVAQRMEARMLIVPSVARAGGSVTLRILQFDTKADAPRTAEAHTSGKNVDSLLPQVPKLLREVLGVAEKPAQEPAAAPAAEAAPQEAPAEDAAAPVEPSEPRRGISVAPVVIGIGGLVAVAGGLAFGAMMKSTQDDYAKQPVQTQDQARAADKVRERGERQALVATVLLGVGAAAVVTSGVWLALEIGRDKGEAPAQAALVPTIGPRSAGLTLVGTWEEARR